MGAHGFHRAAQFRDDFLAGAAAGHQLQHATLLREFFQLIRETFPREIEIRQNTPRDVWPILADQTQFHQLPLNLCVNARDAMPQRGMLTVGLSCAPARSTWTAPRRPSPA